MNANSTSFWFWENCIPPDTCQSFINLFDEDLAKDGEYYENNQPIVGKKRDTKVFWLKNNTHLGYLLFSYILLANNASGWLFDINHIEDVQLGKYSVDGHYDWHRDQDSYARDGSGTQRKLSVSFLLSDPDTYEGGDLLIDGVDHPIPKKQGTIIVFPSCIRHIVTPVTSGVRYSAVAWARGPYFK